ncbi:DNA-binding NtrC family response regulator [Balneicella halophila]|uniref:DNA-binding NtrC family response regulator n=1 Tax=Balneicella halophila TaxID=1537566 RepID=A0A7L4UQX2_BALHA|nr:sigma-54 dependent transcriptional regulator [Balneicella halophila]PVX52150.1 DNA-binding NtrC family response regulator [Balneicella halophila]
MRVLVVEDNKLSREAIISFLTEELEVQVAEAEDGYEAMAILTEKSFDLVISDIRMPKIGGLELLKNIKKLYPQTEVILITGFAEIEDSITALRCGALDYLMKPISIEELGIIIQNLQERNNLRSENRNLRASVRAINDDVTEAKKRIQGLQQKIQEVQFSENMAIFSTHMKKVVNLALEFHKSRDIPVLIEGETGTGKEMVARLVHSGKDGVTAPFIAVNCAAISSQLFESELFGYEKGAFTGANQTGNIGKLELAQGGTIFLDEISELPLDLQTKLLRVIQQREFFRVGGTSLIKLNVRFIFATNKRLQDLVTQNLFRADLFYRIDIGKIEIKPLRERKEEILPLTQYFLEIFSRKRNKNFKQIGQDARYIIENHEWKGNIRELQNAIERIVLLYDEEILEGWHLSHITTENVKMKKKLGSLIVPGQLLLPDTPFSIEDLEIEIVAKALERFDGNKSKTADYLNLTRSSLRSRIRKIKERGS